MYSIVAKNEETITAAHVDRMVDEVASGGAELLLINANGQPGRTNYPSRVWQPYWDQRGAVEGATEQMRRLHELGIDYLARTLERCRSASIGAGISVRMNDTHQTPWPDDPVHSDFYREHPEWRLEAPYRSKGPYATVYALDYRVPEVREYVMALIRELLVEYRPDTLELDFMRFPLYFPPAEAAQHASTMTDFLQQVRGLDEQVCLLARVPVTPASAADYGFDVPAWAAGRLVDGVTVTAHFNTAWDMDIPEWRRLVGADIALFAGAESAAICPEGLPGPSTQDGTTERVMGVDERLLRGFASAQLAAGADGVYLFNYFCAREWKSREPLFGALGQLRDPEGLSGKPKIYCLTAAGGEWHLGESDGPLQVPRVLPCRIPQAFTIQTGQEPPGLPVEVEFLADRVDSIEDLPRFRLHVNGRSVGNPVAIRRVADAPADSRIRAIVFSLSTDVLVTGRNTVVLRNDGETVEVVSAVIRVDVRT